MQLPKMILFDYGHTLVYEPGFDGLRGSEAVLRHAVDNPLGCTAEDIRTLSTEMFEGAREVRDMGLEIHNLIASRFVYEYFQITFNVTPQEIEEVFWDNAAPGELMQYIGETLGHLREQGIRTGVISNIGFSGATLERRLKRLIPDHTFEYVIASSEYALRKPDPRLFELALRKAGLSASEVWFCGDNTKLDVAGSANAGLFPVWYHSELECHYHSNENGKRPDCEHLYIRDWRALAAALRDL